jgi:hypothetical protein
MGRALCAANPRVKNESEIGGVGNLAQCLDLRAVWKRHREREYRHDYRGIQRFAAFSALLGVLLRPHKIARERFLFIAVSI